MLSASLREKSSMGLSASLSNHPTPFEREIRSRYYQKLMLHNRSKNPEEETEKPDQIQAPPSSYHPGFFYAKNLNSEENEQDEATNPNAEKSDQIKSKTDTKSNPMIIPKRKLEVIDPHVNNATFSEFSATNSTESPNPDPESPAIDIKTGKSKSITIKKKTHKNGKSSTSKEKPWVDEDDLSFDELIDSDSKKSQRRKKKDTSSNDRKEEDADIQNDEDSEDPKPKNLKKKTKIIPPHLLSGHSEFSIAEKSRIRNLRFEES